MGLKRKERKFLSDLIKYIFLINNIPKHIVNKFNILLIKLKKTARKF